MLRSQYLFPFALIVLAGACAAQRPLILERAPSQQAVGESGWELSGGASEFYAVHRDGEGDRASWLLEPVSDTYGKYATWMRHVDASDFRAKRVRITATTRTQGATRRVDFWARAQAVDSPGDGHWLGGDSKHLPPDSAWQVDAIVMDVPTETKWLEYGVGVAGPGKVWLQSAKLELVGPDVPLTHGRANGERGAGPSPVRGWILAGDDPSNFAISIDSASHRAGRASATLRCLSPHPKGFGTLMQNFEPGAFLGTRVKLSAFIKSEGVSNWAGLWMRVDGSDGRRKNNSVRQHARPPDHRYPRLDALRDRARRRDRSCRHRVRRPAPWHGAGLDR